MLVEAAFGDAGLEIVIEDFLKGEELSVLALTDGEQLLLLPAAQDHKRLGEGDTGPNTGGMGAYCPVSVATPGMLERVRREVLDPAIRDLAAQGAPFQGVLYAGLMLAADGTLAVLEFNCRFGDPEAQALLPVLPGVTRHLADIAAGRWRPGSTALAAKRAAVATVLAAPGYPISPSWVPRSSCRAISSPGRSCSTRAPSATRMAGSGCTAGGCSRSPGWATPWARPPAAAPMRAS